MAGQRLECALKLALELLTAGQQAVPLEQIQVRQRRGAAGGVAGIRGSLSEDHPARPVPERIRDPTADDRAAEWQITARDALRKHDHVGLHAPALDSEPRSEAA